MIHSIRKNFLISSLVSVYIVLIMALITACVTTSETKRKTIHLLPEAQLNSMGVQSYKEILSKEKKSTDPKLNEMVNEIGKRIALVSGKNYSWEFQLLDNPKVVNAFCLPGGKVAVYTGILPIAKNTAGLAAIMGHEVAHAILQHGNERISQQLIIQSGLAVTAITLANNKYKNYILASMGLGSSIGVALPFSRMHESEADKVGTNYMARAGYDPREAIELWKRMAKLEGGRVPELISTHPNPEKRSRDLEVYMNEVLPLYEASQKQVTKDF